MPKAFVKTTFTPFIARVRRLVTRVESDPSRFRVSDFEAVRDQMIAWAKANNKALFDNFVEAALAPRLPDGEEPPAIFKAVMERYNQQWENSLRRAFLVADQSVDRPSQGGFLARIRRAVRRFTGRARSEDRGGVFKFGSKTYYLNKVLRVAATKSVVQVPLESMLPFLRSDSEFDGAGYEAVVAIGPEKILLSGKAAITTAKQQGARTVPVRFVRPEDLRIAEVKVLAVVSPRGGRVRTLRIVPYLQMLFRTLPQQFERDLIRWSIRFYEDRPWFRVLGGVAENSAYTCRWANGRVFDESGLEYITKSGQLRDHLFHPNCRHRIARVPNSYKGGAWTAADIAARVRNGRIQ